MENSTQQDINLTEGASGPEAFNQNNPENSHPIEFKISDENEAAAANFDIPDPPQTQITINGDGDEPMLTSDELVLTNQIDKMTLEQKKDLLNKFNHLPFLKVGTYVDAVDTTHNFLLSKIVEVDTTQVLVNFDGWPQKWNSWHRFKQVFPFRTKQKGYSGQKKVASRSGYSFSIDELERHHQKVNQLTATNLEGMSAHDTTQYFSGELFIYIDCLLSDSYPDETVLVKVDAFFKAVLRMIVTWLVKIPQLTKVIEEMEALPNLFLVDPKAAIVESSPELMETLGKLFGNCMRALHFFSFYDINQVEPHVIQNEVLLSGNGVIPNSFGIVVQDLTNFDLTKKRYGPTPDEESKYNENLARGEFRNRKDIQYAYVLNWVQYFAELGGFDAVMKLLEMNLNEEKAVKAPFSIIGQVTRAFKCLNMILNPEFAKIFSSRISEIIVKRLSTMTEQDVKVCSKDQIEQVIVDLNQVLQLGIIAAERSKIIEHTELSIGLRFLKSTNLEKRIRGLQDIKMMIERVVKTAQLATYTKRISNNWTQNQADNDIDTKIQTTGFLNQELLCQWLIQNKVLETIFGQGAHIEIVKRSQPILNFIALKSQGLFDEQTVELIWRCQIEKHEEMIRTVYNLIEQTLPVLNLDVINMFFVKVSQESRYDEKFLTFLKQFTIIALEKQYYKLEQAWQAQQEEMSEQSDYSYNFDNYLVKEEGKFIDNIESQIKQQQHSENNQYGIPIFWKIFQDGSKQSKEIQDLALKSLFDMFKQGFRKTNRLFCLAIALGELFNKQSIVQSAKIIKAVIQSFNIDQNQRMQYGDEEQHLINSLQQKIKFLDRVVLLLNEYHELVKQKLKTTQFEESEDIVFTGNFAHERTIKTFLNLIKYLLIDINVSLGVKNIQQLWDIFVDQPNFAKEQVIFINWINRSKSDHLMSNSQKVYHDMFTIEEKKFIFTSILCPSATKPNANINLAKCFNTYFLMINKSEGALKNTSKRLRVVQFDKLQGLDALWDISLNQTNQKARDLCQDLLINLYLKQQEPDLFLLRQFVDNCMQDVRKEGVVSLLSMFLDRYEGIKEVKIEADLQRRIPGIKPIMIKVLSHMDDQPFQKLVGLTYYQSLGYFRMHIAEAFGLHQNEFILILKGKQVIDPEVDDDKYMKDFSGMFGDVQIKRNPKYDPTLHPKYFISENQEYFERIFGMLRTSPTEKLDAIYDLFVKLPVNKTLRQSFVSLSQVRDAETQEAKTNAWSELLDPTSMFRLLYCVQIINELILKDEGEWVQSFIQIGGLNQLIKCLINLNIIEVDSMLKLKCLKDLINLIQLLLKDRFQELDQVPRAQLLHKIFDQIEMICDFSISSEKRRGVSYETLIKRIDAARIRKMNQKLHSLNNKNEKKTEDDDGDSEDKIIQTSLLKEFKDQAEVVNNMFNIFRTVCQVDQQTGIEVIRTHDLNQFLKKGLIISENLVLRNCVGCRLFELLFPLQNSNTSNEHKVKILESELSLVQSIDSEYERRCFDYYKHLASLITNSDNYLHQIEDLATSVISYLTDFIVFREIKESNTTEQDQHLQGSIVLLSSLLQKYPKQKESVGQKLLRHLLHDCLFEIPHGNKGNQNQCAPKCKSLQTRQQALNLVSVLSRDCLQNLQEVLTYLSHFNQEATWRTPKEADWNIKLYNDEKSSTGHVGIKNLACICYMNSLNQQLFMVPSFRNDVLSIQDPNNNKDPDEDNFFLQWQTLFTGLLLSEKMYVNPKSYCHAFKDWEGNRVNVVEQMDVEEYLTMFFDKLESAIKGTPQAKTIQHHFGGELANEIICKTCPHQYERKENFLTLQLSVKNKKSIIEGLTSFVSGDVLDEGNQYMCEKCDKKVDALKRVVIKTLPRYLITTLQRFEFDMDSMLRVKVNDYYEFPHDLDMTNYTQEYLAKKVKGGEFTMNHHPDYYNYELVGIVVHSGTADSGHYYSYIKEQERFEENQTEKWYEFNDTFVRDFDKSDIPSECFGGIEQSPGWGVKGYMKTASAYIVVYKRKMEEAPVDSDDETQDQIKNEILGQKKLVLKKDSPLAKKIAKQNHKYWQSRFQFSHEYTEFVCQLTSQWNTNFVIPAQCSDRNDDSYLYSQHSTLKSVFVPIATVSAVNDIPLQLDQMYTTQQIADTQFKVFKFAASHYITVMQRAEDKTHLPTMVKYLKSYINCNTQWARWFLQQFINPEIIKECFFECSNKLMRSILTGLVFCAMIKVYQEEKSALKDFWIDYKSNKPLRQTVLGNFILLLAYMLPSLKLYNKNHQQTLQILARFSSLGEEARSFMIEAQVIESLLNYFYWDCSPYLEEFKNAQRISFDINLKPEIGLPTPESGNEKKSSFAMLKRNLRLKRMQTEEPRFSYLIETIANLARSTSNLQNKPTKFQLNQSNLTLGDHDTVLFLPSHEFLEKIFYNSSKPRILNTLCKAYMHFAVHDESVANKLWETVQYGLKEYEHNKARPYFILFQHLMEASSESKFIEQHADTLLADFFRKVIAINQRFFQWMEVAIDFVFKLYTRIPFVKQWMQQNVQAWEFLFDWLDKNKEPPLQYANSSGQLVYRMNRGRSGTLNAQRYNKTQNQVLYYYRHTILTSMRNKVNIDYSQDVDLDLIDVQDFKFIQGMKVDILEDKFVPVIIPGIIMTDLDEIVNVKSLPEDNSPEQTQWILTQKVKIFPQGIIQRSHKYQEMQRISELLQKKAENDAANRAKLALEQAQKSTVFQGNQGSYFSNNHASEDEDEDQDMRDEANFGGNRTGQAIENDDEYIGAESTDQNFDVDINNEQIQDFYDGQISD